MKHFNSNTLTNTENAGSQAVAVGPRGAGTKVRSGGQRSGRWGARPNFGMTKTIRKCKIVIQN